MTTIEILRRNYNLERLLPNDLTWDVINYSNKAYGGPFKAEINVSGPDESLWELLNILRDKISFRDDMGELVWWGYIAEVEVTARNPLNPDQNKTRVGVSLDTMFNRVAIAWEDIAVGTQAGERKTTDWVQDDFSISEYAKKEGLFSGTSASDQTLAEQARDTLLVRKKYPIALIDLNASGESTATIRCRGWWDTLNWLYCAVPVELAFAYTTVNFNFGVGRTGYEQIAQGIIPSGGDINLSSLKIYARYTGAPTDDITVSIFTNPDDLTPTTLI